MRRCLPTALFALVLGAPLPALAQSSSPSCPPGAWFCEETEVPPPEVAAPEEATPDEDAAALDEAPPPPARHKRAPKRAAKRAPPQSAGTTVVVPAPQAGQAAPPVVVYQTVPSAPGNIVIVSPGAAPPAMPAVPPPPPVRPVRWHRSWGLNLRLEGVMLGRSHGASENAGMGGLGVSLRYRPVPAFALEGGVDLLAGVDYNGFRRTEVPLSLGALLYLNPRSRVQVYLTGGADWSHATVESDDASPMLTSTSGGNSAEYDYFGGHGGAGLEFRVSPRIGLNIDAIGFVRSRTDEGRIPEFIDPNTGRTSNTSGGGLFRGGLTFWW